MEKDRDGDLMSLVGRCSDCSDARWTPRYRDLQAVTVNIKVTSLDKIYAGLQAQRSSTLFSAGLGISQSAASRGLIF